MTRKDYEKIAKAIREARQSANSAGHLIGNSDVAHIMAAELKAENPRFDRARFLKACGLEGNYTNNGAKEVLG